MESAPSLTEKKKIISNRPDQNIEMESFQYKLQSFVANWEDFLYLLLVDLYLYLISF